MRIFITLLAILLAVPAVAQDDEAFEGRQVIWPEFEDSPPDAPTARIGFVFDEVSRSREGAIEVGEPVEVILVAWDVQVALRAWEARLEFDPRLVVTEKDYIADLHLEGDGDVRAMLKTENCRATPALVLAKFTLLLLEEANDLVLGIGPATNPTELTVETDAPLPAPLYQVCREETDMRPFLYSEISAVLNPVSVHPDPIDGEKPSFQLAPGRGRQ